MKVFFDTNVLLDVLAERQPFYADSAAVWTLAEERRIEGLIPAVSFTNVFYVVRKLEDLRTARRALKLLRGAFGVVACDAQIINQAMDGDVRDFEDAVQLASAVEAGADCILSRNPDDFPRRTECPVLTPTAFLAAYLFE